MSFIEIKEDEQKFWLDCPNCNEKPRKWEFDNGRYAICKCNKEYDDKNYISATPIRECYTKDGIRIKEYNHYELRDNWNKHIKHLERKIKIKNFLNNSK